MNEEIMSNNSSLEEELDEYAQTVIEQKKEIEELESMNEEIMSNNSSLEEELDEYAQTVIEQKKEIEILLSNKGVILDRSKKSYLNV